MPQPLDIDIYAKHLFSDEIVMREAQVPVDTRRRIYRIRDEYNHWKRFPSLSEKEMRAWVAQSFPEIKKHMAWQDIWLIKQLLGAFERDTKQWHAYNFNKEIMDTYHKAKAAGDYRSAEKALADYAKYNRLDKSEEVPDGWWERIVPQQFTPTSDPRVIGIEPMEGLRDKIQHYNKVFREEAVDADYEEIQAAARYEGEIKDDDEEHNDVKP